MANGDAAQAAGMDVVLGTADRRLGYDEINKTRDYIAQRTSTVTPVNKGGTGATAAQAARANLGIAEADPNISSGTLVLRDSNKAIAADYLYLGQAPQLAQHAAPKSYVDNAASSAASSAAGSRVAKSGDTMSGDLYLPNSSSANSGYTIAYINGDGRVSRGASSERFKKYISQVEPAVLGDLFPDLFRFQMRTGDGAWRFGYIAERLAESDDLRPFVIWETEDDGKTLARDNGQPVPLSIDFIGLLIAQVSQLHQRLSLAETALDDVLPRLAALEDR